MRILLVSPYLPYRTVGHGGGVATYQFARHLARRHDVTVLCFQRAGEAARAQDLIGEGVRVETVPFASDQDRGLKRLITMIDRAAVRLRSWLTWSPWGVVKYDRAAMVRRLQALIESDRPDVIILEHTQLARYARVARDHLRTRQLPGHVVLNTHEAGVLSRRRRYENARGLWARLREGNEFRRWARLELGALAWADTVTCVTAQDRDLLARLSGRTNLRIMPMGVGVDACPPVDQRRAAPPHLLFVGAFHHLPNRDAFVELVTRTMPAVLRDHPGAILDVVGGSLSPSLARLAEPLGAAVRLHGFVEDLEPLYGRAWLVVAPLFSGGGIKIKILEAAARGCAVLTTPIGLEGIDLATGASPEVFEARASAEFGAAARELLHDPDSLAAVGTRARAAILARYDWAAIVDDLTRYLESVSGRPVP